MEKEKKKLSLKIIIPIVVAIVVIAIIGIVVFTSSKGTHNKVAEEMTKEEMLEVAEEKTGEYFQELGENEALAETQINNIFKISGVTYNITSDNVEIVVGDDTICKMYLPKEELSTLKKNQDITVVGKLTKFSTKNLVLTKVAYFEFKNCYIVDNDISDVYIGDSSTPISIRDITQTYENNESRFYEEYKDKQVRFTGTIEKIQSNILQSGSSIAIDTIEFKEGWKLEFPTGFCNKLSQLNKGDKLEVTSKIKSAVGGIVTVFDYGYTGGYKGIPKNNINGSSIKFNGEEICIVND